MAEKLTSIVVLSLNRYDDLKRCISSVYKHTPEPFELVVWDNHSTDVRIRQYLEKLQKEKQNAKVIFSDENIGCSNGRREAIQQANPAAAYIVTLDNDMEVTNSWLGALIRRVEEAPDIGAAASNIVFPKKHFSFFKKHPLAGTIHLNGGFIEKSEKSNFPRVAFKTHDTGKNPADPSTRAKRDCDWLPGGALLVKKEAARQVEHSPDYPCGYEDYAYSFDIKKVGYRLVNCPNSLAYHHSLVLWSEKENAKERTYIDQRHNADLKRFSCAQFYANTGMIPYDSEIPPEAESLKRLIGEKRALRNILASYGLHEGIVIDRSDKQTHVNYVILSERKKYLVKVYGRKEKERIEREQKIIAFLQQYQFQFIAYPLPLPAVSLPAHHLVEMIPGRAATEKDGFIVGQMLGRFHRALQRFPVPAMATRSRFYFDAWKRECESILFFLSKPETRFEKNLRIFCEKSLQQIAGYIDDQIFPSSLPKQVCHNDIWEDNIRITPEGKAFLLDLEGCGPEIRAFECAVGGYLFIENRCEFQEYAKAYQKQVPLTAEERQMIPFCLKLWNAWCITHTLMKQGGFANLSKPLQKEIQKLMQRDQWIDQKADAIRKSLTSPHLAVPTSMPAQTQNPPASR